MSARYGSGVGLISIGIALATAPARTRTASRLQRHVDALLAGLDDILVDAHEELFELVVRADAELDQAAQLRHGIPDERVQSVRPIRASNWRVAARCGGGGSVTTSMHVSGTPVSFCTKSVHRSTWQAAVSARRCMWLRAVSWQRARARE